MLYLFDYMISNSKTSMFLVHILICVLTALIFPGTLSGKNRTNFDDKVRNNQELNFFFIKKLKLSKLAIFLRIFNDLYKNIFKIFTILILFVMKFLNDALLWCFRYANSFKFSSMQDIRTAITSNINAILGSMSHNN